MIQPPVGQDLPVLAAAWPIVHRSEAESRPDLVRVIVSTAREADASKTLGCGVEVECEAFCDPLPQMILMNTEMDDDDSISRVSEKQVAYARRLIQRHEDVPAGCVLSKCALGEKPKSA